MASSMMAGAKWAVNLEDDRVPGFEGPANTVDQQPARFGALGAKML